MTEAINNGSQTLTRVPSQLSATTTPTTSFNASTAASQTTHRVGMFSNKRPSASDVHRSLSLLYGIKDKDFDGTQGVSLSRRVNEDELYPAVLHAKLALDRPDLAAKFEQQLPEMVKTFSEQTSDNVFFKSSDRIMRQFLRDDEINREEYRAFRDFAFGVSQLDSNRGRLSIARAKDQTNPNDTPLREVGTALEKIVANAPANQSEIEAFRAYQAELSKIKWREQHKASKSSESGVSSSAVSAPASSASASGSSAVSRSASTSTGSVQSTGISQGFLWKPISDSDGNLAILLPAFMTGLVAGLEIIGPDGKPIAVGRDGGVGNGDRMHFRFNQPGGSFPPGCQVLIHMKDGTAKSIKIDNPGSRIECSGK